jgi:hypothetical protein
VNAELPESPKNATVDAESLRRPNPISLTTVQSVSGWLKAGLNHRESLPAEKMTVLLSELSISAGQRVSAEKKSLSTARRHSSAAVRVSPRA